MTPIESQQDDLTGLLTRRAFMAAFAEQIALAQGNEKPLSLAFMDIDNFMTVNDTYGHSGGDLVLQAIAQKVIEVVGQGAVVGRYGGDEFVILFPGVERERVFLILEKIRSEVETLSLTGGRDGTTISALSITGGLASFPVDGRTHSELMRKADQALYRAKVNGRNCIRLAYEERMVTKTTHFTMTQLERLTRLAEARNVGEAELLREALDDLLAKYEVTDIER
jgi:diguanylate cyclase (GGDEF)-like protein